MYSSDTNFKIAELRVKAAQGTLPKEEMAEALTLLREGRAAAQTASTAKRTSKAKAKPDADALLGELDAFQ